jgi:hypothetical protein
LWWTAKREDRRLGAGRTYELPTFIAPRDWVRNYYDALSHENRRLESLDIPRAKSFHFQSSLKFRSVESRAHSRVNRNF